MVFTTLTRSRCGRWDCCISTDSRSSYRWPMVSCNSRQKDQNTTATSTAAVGYEICSSNHTRGVMPCVGLEQGAHLAISVNHVGILFSSRSYEQQAFARDVAICSMSQPCFNHRIKTRMYVAQNIAHIDGGVVGATASLSNKNHHQQPQQICPQNTAVIVTMTPAMASTRQPINNSRNNLRGQHRNQPDHSWDASS